MVDQSEKAGRCEEVSDSSLETLRAQRSFLRQVLDINPTLIFAKDRAGRFTLVNKTLADIYGTTVEDLIGKTDADFNPNEEQVAYFRRVDLDVMDSLKEVVIPEEELTDASGQTHWVQTVKRPIIGPDGVANQVLGVATEITQRRQLEEQLRQAQKMDALGRLAGGIAHDFNNLLAVILGNGERILRSVKREEGADQSDMEGLELIVSAGERAAMLVRQLLAFSRKQPMSPVVLDVNPVVAEMEDLLRRLIGEHIRLEVNCQSAACYVRADPTQIEQIIVNLAVNGRDAMPEGGTLVIETACVTLDAEHGAKHPDAREGLHVMLSVADTGVGMSPETLNRIFEPFFTTKLAGEGTGLGLATVYGIVKQAGGHVVAESELHKGSVFKVYIPAVQGPRRDVEAAGVEAVVTGDETILVCEDEEDVLQLACGILEDHGFRTIATVSGEQALKRAAAYDGPIDLLLTDVVMPRMNGRQLAESLLVKRPNVKVLYMTGYSADVLGPMHAQQDWGEWLTKPFTSMGLLKHVRAVLDA